MGHSLYGIDEERLKAANPSIVFTQGMHLNILHREAKLNRPQTKKLLNTFYYQVLLYC